MVLNEYFSLATQEVQEQIGKALQQFPGHSAGDAAVITESLVERSGILREESPGEISFIHNAFKELLAGDYFAAADAAGLLAKHALDPSWQPVVLFAVAADRRGFATKVIQKILERGWSINHGGLRAKQLMALKCRASALYVEEKLDIRLQEFSTNLFPPRTMEDAEALAIGGNAAVSFLVNREDLTDTEAAATIRALRLISTPEARQALRRFLGDRRSTVISELAHAVNPLEIKWIQETLIKGETIAEGIRYQVADLSPIENFENLKVLDLTGINAEDISPIGNLKQLEALSLARTPVADLSPLANLEHLEFLYLAGSAVVDLSPLMNLKNLQVLNLDRTAVVDLSPLANLKNLQLLSLFATQVVDLSPVEKIENLRITTDRL